MDFLPDGSEAFQKEALASERQGTWTKRWLNHAKDKRLFHLVVPKQYGGHQLPLPKLLPVLEQASYLDGSYGWTLTLGSGAGIFAAYMNPDFARKQFSNPETFITGSGYPAGTAAKTAEGFKATGEWKYATGAPHATLFTASCGLHPAQKKETENQSVKVLTFYPAEVNLQPGWNSYGLKATASHDFIVEDVVVPPERTFALDPDDLIIDGPLYRFPFQTFAECTLAASLAGIARHFLQEASNLLQTKTDSPKKVEQQLEQSIEAVNHAWQKLLDYTGDAWKHCEQKMKVNQKQQNKIARAARNITEVSLSHAQKLYPHCGMAILDETSVANRAWRDLHTASQHMLLTPSIK